MVYVNIYSLRALTLDDKLYEFTVLDIPVMVGENKCVLLNRRFSPIIQYDTITLGSDVGVYVGDVLRDRMGNLWYVTYNCGFCAVSKETGEKRKLFEFSTLNVVRQATRSELARYCNTNIKFKFKYRGKPFVFMDIIGKLGNKMLVTGFDRELELDEIQQDTGISVSGKRMYLGDLYKGSKTLQCFGRLCTQSEFGAYDITTKEYITKLGGFKTCIREH